MNRLSTSRQLILLVAVMTVLLLTVGSIGLLGINKTNESLRTVYVDRTVPMWQLSEIRRLMQRSFIVFLIGLNNRSSDFKDTVAPEIDANLDNVHQLYRAYLKSYLTPEEKRIAGKFERALEDFESRGLRPAVAALAARNYEQAHTIMMEQMVPLAAPYRTHLVAITRLQLTIASEEYEAATARFRLIRAICTISMIAGVAFAVLLGGFLVRSIVRSKREFELSLHAKRDLERQLQQSQKIQALGQLTGGMAHDFNNLLTAILGYSNLALDKYSSNNDAKLSKYLQEVIAAGERGRDLVGKMLTFTRTTPNDHASMVAPADVVREVGSMMAHTIPSNIVLSTRIEDASTISIDSGELNQVLVNLVINARDAIQGQGHGHGRIEIVVRQQVIANRTCMATQKNFSGHFLCIEVSDTGNGIAPENLSRVFDPFFTTKAVGKGTGLGLSMVQGIMMRAGGHILLQSVPGKGSIFQLLFPIPIADQREELAELLRTP